MVSPENTNWLFDYGFINDIANPNANLSDGQALGFSWPAQALAASAGDSMKMAVSLGDSDSHKKTGSKKRARPESSAATSSKACREKQRRDRLNDKFMELAAILEPGTPPKMDKSAVLVDAIRMVNHLRGEAQKLKDSNPILLERIKELKGEKNELRDEKLRLKAEKERVESMIKNIHHQHNFLPTMVSPATTIPSRITAQGGPVAANKLMPIISYPAGVGVAMWQFMPPAAVDTSQDHVLRPPVA